MRALALFAFLLCPLMAAASPFDLDGGMPDGAFGQPAEPAIAAPPVIEAMPAAAMSLPAPMPAPRARNAAVVDVQGLVLSPGGAGGSADDIFVASREAFEAVKAARRAPTAVGIAAAISAGLIVLIALARRFGAMLLTSNQVRVFIVCATAALGGLAGVTNGTTWTEAALVVLAPLLAVGVHQIFLKPRSRASMFPG